MDQVSAYSTRHVPCCVLEQQGLMTPKAILLCQ